MLARLEALVPTRRGAALLVVCALVAWWIEAIAWPAAAGRDFGVYVRYYAMLFDADPVLPWAMLTRTPLGPLVVGGLLEPGRGWLVEIGLAALFAASVLAWVAAAATFGARAALATGAALLLYPGYGALFHDLSGDVVYASAFAAWALLVTRASAAPSAARFAAVGAGVAALALVRPASQALLIAAGIPLVLAGPRRQRLASAAACAATGALVLAAWAVVNDMRYGQLTVARGGASSLPLFRAFTTDLIVQPDNGPASRELADVVARELLPVEPYRSRDIDLETFFSSGSLRMHDDLVSLSDRVLGWDTNYALLARVGREAVRSRPGDYVEGVAGSLWEELSDPFLPNPRPGRSSVPAGSPAPEDDPAAADEARPADEDGGGEPIPSSHQSPFLSTPEGGIREVWTGPDEHRIVFDDPADEARLATVLERMDELGDAFPDRAGNDTLHTWLSRASKAYPPLWLWLLVGAAAAVWRRPARPAALVAPPAAALVVLLATVLAVYAVPLYAVPVAPAFVLFACGAAFGRRAADDR